MAANSNAKIDLVFGAGSVRRTSPFGDDDVLKRTLEILKKEGVGRIDTAHLYGDSEAILGRAAAGRDFVIDTKIKGGFEPGSAKKERVIKGADESLERLAVDKLGTFYIHAPDYDTPISESLAGINQVFKAGKFARFGISNYKPEDVEAIYEHCKEHGYPLPTVYQGNYSPVARKLEFTLLPTLRKLGISFYVYSPMAGGFLSKTKEDILSGAGRFKDTASGSSMYSKLYRKPAYLAALADWEAIADSAGCTKAELAYRWVAYNSQLNPEHGDGLLIGASGVEQLQQTLDNLKKGPLDQKVADRIDNLWKSIESEAPTDNFHY